MRAGEVQVVTRLDEWGLRRESGFGGGGVLFCLGNLFNALMHYNNITPFQVASNFFFSFPFLSLHSMGGCTVFHQGYTMIVDLSNITCTNGCLRVNVRCTYSRTHWVSIAGFPSPFLTPRELPKGQMTGGEGRVPIIHQSCHYAQPTCNSTIPALSLPLPSILYFFPGVLYRYGAVQSGTK